MHKDEELVLTKTETKLLYDIRELLIKISNALHDNQEHTLDNMKRPELMRLYKEKIKNPPKGWTKKSNEDLIREIKEVS